MIKQLYDAKSNTYTYILIDQPTLEAAIIDSVQEQNQRDIQLIKELGLKLKYCIETHVHADHITGTHQLREAFNCLAVVPESAEVKNADYFVKDNEELKLGKSMIKAIATPGHTGCHSSYFYENSLFTGDCLFIRGCGRTDFQSGDPSVLYDSIFEKLFKYPDETKVYPGHDYKGMTCSTIKEEKLYNPRLQNGKQWFIEHMNNLNLPEPKLIKIAVPKNQVCGR